MTDRFITTVEGTNFVNADVLSATLKVMGRSILAGLVDGTLDPDRATIVMNTLMED